MADINMKHHTPYRRRRTRMLYDQKSVHVLEKVFLKDPYPDIFTREQIATDLGISEARIQTWFQNKRSRTKRVHPQNISPNVANENQSNITTPPSGKTNHPIKRKADSTLDDVSPEKSRKCLKLESPVESKFNKSVYSQGSSLMTSTPFTNNSLLPRNKRKHFKNNLCLDKDTTRNHSKKLFRPFENNDNEKCDGIYESMKSGLEKNSNMNGVQNFSIQGTHPPPAYMYMPAWNKLNGSCYFQPVMQFAPFIWPSAGHPLLYNHYINQSPMADSKTPVTLHSSPTTSLSTAAKGSENSGYCLPSESPTSTVMDNLPRNNDTNSPNLKLGESKVLSNGIYTNNISNQSEQEDVHSTKQDSTYDVMERQHRIISPSTHISHFKYNSSDSSLLNKDCQ